jgi:gliding motility-associated-like protein
VVKNYSGVTLRNVVLTDSLEKGFNRQTGAVCKVTNAPVAISTGCTLLLNSRFNGMEDTRLSLDDSTSTLAAGKVDTLIFTVNVAPDGSNNTFWNTVQVTAKAGTTLIRDTSTNGLEPDLNGNGNPSDSNESEPTPLTLQVAPQSLFIPEGFSPNGDGINDVFVIRGATGLTISLEVFNRWGHMIYKNEDYQNDWDSKPNTGIVVGGDANGVPSGTYYYVIKLSDGRRFVHYMIINR